ncbi:MAG: hypothetical protein QM533_01465 [Cytophagales bacterium]|nr:hypothetical protein [Cytophagales bacterium]
MNHNTELLTQSVRQVLPTISAAWGFAPVSKMNEGIEQAEKDQRLRIREGWDMDIRRAKYAAEI